MAHEKPLQQSTCAPHRIKGWYVGPGMDHYRDITAYIPSTYGERICDNVEYFPHSTPFPSFSDTDILQKATENILAVLNKPALDVLFPFKTSSMKAAIRGTATLLHLYIDNSNTNVSNINHWQYNYCDYY